MPLELDPRQRAMLQEMGVHVWLPGTDFAPHAEQVVAQPNTRMTAAEPAVGARGQAPVAVPAAPLPSTSSQPGQLGALDGPALADVAANCQACGLCAGRKHSTLGPQNSPRPADWLVVGDPPDEDEDRTGQPFAQDTGVLLDNMLKAVGASRTGVGPAGAYLSNVVKCRPPQGRIAQTAELAQCAMYLQREIALVTPKVIVAMGRFAMQTVLSEQPELANVPLGKLRGSVYRYRGVPVVVTYHPKVLLRASADKGKAWADLCLALDVVQSRSVDQ